METTMQTEIHEFRLDDPHDCESFIAHMVMVCNTFPESGGVFYTPEETHVIARIMAKHIVEKENERCETFFANMVMARGLSGGKVVAREKAHIVAKQVAARIVENNA
jgi:hypothetical protein